MDTLVDHGGGLVEALNARVYGNGNKTLVLSHGFGSDQLVWFHLIPYLACYFKVVVFDLAFSASVSPKLYNPERYSKFDAYADDLLCLLDQLKVETTFYVGHSMSAMIGCIAATKRPQLFEHLVLLGGSPRYLNEQGYNGGLEISDIETTFNQINHNFSKWVQNFSRSAIGVNDMTATTEFKYSLGRMKPEIALDVAKAVFLSDLRWLLPKVQVPCTIIQSQKDFVVPESVAFYMKRELGCSAKVELLPTEGHFPQLTAYHLLLDVLKAVLPIPG